MLANVDQSQNPYTIGFEVDPKYIKNGKVKTPVKKDTAKTYVAVIAPVEAIHTLAAPTYLQNGDFEWRNDRNLHGWHINVNAFM